MQRAPGDAGEWYVLVFSARESDFRFNTPLKGERSLQSYSCCSIAMYTLVGIFSMSRKSPGPSRLQSASPILLRCFQLTEVFRTRQMRERSSELRTFWVWTALATLDDAVLGYMLRPERIKVVFHFRGCGRRSCQLLVYFIVTNYCGETL